MRYNRRMNTPPRILCLTMNPSVDLATETESVVPTHKLRCGDTLHDAGGGGINVARVLTRLGGECTSLCPTGGSAGHWLETRMREEGIPSVFLPIADETRVSFTVHEHSTGAEFRFVMPGPHLTEPEWQACLSQLEQMPEFPDLLVASGSLPPGVPVDFYARLARLCRERGALYLDTCIEPWAGGYDDPSLSLAERSNYALREAALTLRAELGQSGQHGAVVGTVGRWCHQHSAFRSHALLHQAVVFDCCVRRMKGCANHRGKPTVIHMDVRITGLGRQRSSGRCGACREREGCRQSGAPI